MGALNRSRRVARDQARLLSDGATGLWLQPATRREGFDELRRGA